MATETKRPGSRLAIVVIVLLAVSAAVIAMWRVSTTSTVQEAPYFPPGHIQIASNQQQPNPATGANEAGAGAGAPEPAPAPTRTSEATESVPSSDQPKPAEAITNTPPSPPPSSEPTASTPVTTEPKVASSPDKPTKAGLEPTLADVRESVEQWRTSWESRQAASYVEFYHPRFPGLTAFARQKNSVMGRAEFIEVKVTELKLSLEAGFTKAQFKQHYKSNTYESFDLKTQHWVMTNSGPRIIEETIRSLSR
jgi:hypothetical protein